MEITDPGTAQMEVLGGGPGETQEQSASQLISGGPGSQGAIEYLPQLLIKKMPH